MQESRRNPMLLPKSRTLYCGALHKSCVECPLGTNVLRVSPGDTVTVYYSDEITYYSQDGSYYLQDGSYHSQDQSSYSQNKELQSGNKSNHDDHLPEDDVPSDHCEKCFASASKDTVAEVCKNMEDVIQGEPKNKILRVYKNSELFLHWIIDLTQPVYVMTWVDLEERISVTQGNVSQLIFNKIVLRQK